MWTFNQWLNIKTLDIAQYTQLPQFNEKLSIVRQLNEKQNLCATHKQKLIKKPFRISHDPHHE